jgi:protein-S-isoprenylcysteine O-methyltransferase Ste14
MMLAYLPVCNLPGMFLSRTSILWPVSLWHANFNLTLALSSAVVFFVIINTWSDLTLGLKFSNVSYRGVVKHGPYSIVRHPAYSAKLLGWALALTPSMLTLPGFLAGIFGWLALAAIYIMRALTEERHLSQFPDYREYCASVKKRFVPGLF